MDLGSGLESELGQCVKGMYRLKLVSSERMQVLKGYKLIPMIHVYVGVKSYSLNMYE